ncbi:MAG: hypothetical protein WBV41_19085 [Terriglobales bacterium]
MESLVERRWKFCLAIKVIGHHQQIVIASAVRNLQFAANCLGLALVTTER